MGFGTRGHDQFLMRYAAAIGLWIGALLMALPKQSQAQFQQLPIANQDQKESFAAPNARQQNERLSLPFWDDFSSGTLNPELWELFGVSYSNTIGINAPSLGVVVLDGVDATGTPYSRERLTTGEGDRLSSLPIDLSAVTSAEQSEVILSFFWQAGGKGEMPDDTDQLELQFLDRSGQWVTVWEQQGGDEQDPTRFNQELIPVVGDYFHEAFRFRFLFRGRLSGPFDTWLIDYVYLNTGRNMQDTFYEDRTLTTLPNSPLGKHTAYPLALLDDDLAAGNRVGSQFLNLSNRFRAMEFTALLRNRQTGRTIRQINANTPLNPVPQALERRDFSSSPVESASIMDETEEFDLETLIYLTTGDQSKVDRIVGRDTIFEPSVDFRLNDTVRSLTPIRDFFAYDDGSADYAAGINQTSGMLAVRYHTPSPVYLKGVSINFTNYLQRGTSLELMVWDSLARNPVYVGEILIPDLPGRDEFAYFPIDTTIQVSGAFYVGFMQFTNDFVHVGLDKSTDAGDEIYFNVYGEWQQNDRVVGTLMIRPHVSREPLAIPPPLQDEEVKAYPNPAMGGVVFVSGVADRLVVMDFQGREINVPVESTENGSFLNFDGKQKGLYLVRILQNGKWKAIRLIIR